MPYLNADLHSHSTFSDGTLSPAQLAERARRGGVDLWALTDHDELAGQAAACAAAHALGMDYLTGVEISASYAGHTIHIVGLGFDVQHEVLQQGLHALRHSRGPRAQEMARQLEAAGIAGAYEGALRYVGNPALISRTHFARFLVERGICTSMGEVFQRFLTEGKPGFVPQRWASVAEAVGWITAGGGVAVLAHPARYGLDATLEHALCSHFVACGGQAVEVVCGGHTTAEAARYAQLAQDLGLHGSRGSDFHSPAESRVDLGSLPSLPSALPPVWALLASRIQRAPQPGRDPA
ncbi:PHP domain-containing protein [Comamonas sp. GB3 AK4-5]|uniref:PHP domain-containing protein n=1 Tax=Comamonas sp. GB3 AK4-5 TaxID=3231487 RepID=UPI00351F6CA4